MVFLSLNLIGPIGPINSPNCLKINIKKAARGQPF